MQKILELHHRMGDVDWLAGDHRLLRLSCRNYSSEYHLDAGYLLLPQTVPIHASRMVGGSLRSRHQHGW